MDLMKEQDVAFKIFEARPDAIISIDNEYFTFGMMDQITCKL